MRGGRGKAQQAASRLRAFKEGTYPYGQQSPGPRATAPSEDAAWRAEQEALAEADRARAAQAHKALVADHRVLDEGGRLLLVVYGAPACTPELAAVIRRAKQLARGGMDTRMAVRRAAADGKVALAAVVEALKRMRGAS